MSDSSQKTNTLLATLAIISTIATFLGSLTSIISNLRSIFSYHILLVAISVSALLWVYLIVLKFQKKSNHVMVHTGIYLIPALLISSFFIFRPEEITCTHDKSISVGIANFDESSSGADQTAAQVVETFRSMHNCYTVFSLQTYIEPSNHPDSLKQEIISLSEKKNITKGLVVYGRKAQNGIASCHISIVKPHELMKSAIKLDTLDIRIPKEKITLTFLPVSDDQRICHFIIGTVNYFQGNLETAEEHLEASKGTKENVQQAGFTPSLFTSSENSESSFPHDLESWSNFFLGNIYVVEGDYQQALHSYEASIAENTKNAHAHYNRAILLGKEGKREEAFQGFAIAHGLDSSFVIPMQEMSSEPIEENILEEVEIETTHTIPKPIEKEPVNTPKEKWEDTTKIEEPQPVSEPKNPLAFLDNYDKSINVNKGIYAVQKDGKWGFVTKEGKAVTPIIYEKIGKFNYDRAMVRKDGKWGYIDTKGMTMIPCQYDLAENFQNYRGSVYAAVKKGKKWLAIDVRGNELKTIQLNK